MPLPRKSSQWFLIIFLFNFQLKYKGKGGQVIVLEIKDSVLVYLKFMKQCLRSTNFMVIKLNDLTNNPFNSSSISIFLYLRLTTIYGQYCSITHQMALPITSISCCISYQLNIFYKEWKALAFNRDGCCHLMLCLGLILFHWLIYSAILQ